jgi:hypothetical protein
VVVGHVVELILIERGDIAALCRIRLDTGTVAIPKKPVDVGPIPYLDGAGRREFALVERSDGIFDVVPRALNPAPVGTAICAAGDMGHLFRDRPSALVCRPELIDGDLDPIAYLPDAPVQIGRYTLYIGLGRAVGITKNGIGVSVFSEQHDHRPVILNPVGLDFSPVAAMQVVLKRLDYLHNLLKSGFLVDRLKIAKTVLPTLGIHRDPDHCRVAIDPGDHDEPVAVPRKQRGLRTDAKVLVESTDRLATASPDVEEADQLLGRHAGTVVSDQAAVDAELLHGLPLDPE